MMNKVGSGGGDFPLALRDVSHGVFVRPAAASAGWSFHELPTMDVGGTCVSEHNVFAVGSVYSPSTGNITGLAGAFDFETNNFTLHALPDSLIAGSCATVSDTVVLLGDNNGHIARSVDAAKSWETVLATPQGCFVQKIIAAPHPGLQMAFGSCMNSIGEPEMAVWQSDNEGKTWAKRRWPFKNAGFSFDDAVRCTLAPSAKAGAVAQSPLSVAIDGDGYYYVSYDDGLSWIQRPSGLTPQQGQGLTCLVSTHDSTKVDGFLYQMGSAGGFMRSTDRGNSTHFLDTKPDELYVEAMAVSRDANEPGVVWATTADETTGGLHMYASGDQGQTWSKHPVKP
eukprot:INCI12232.1.p2 GENE.INCI12232.1~~INCI12232.1.p2  ORF type:complete len:339 (-),score=45.56 INCI12232.1:199-1215(-)